MSAADHAADHDPHLEAQQALPWLANGTLQGAELARVQEHLQACAVCRADLSLLHTLRGAGESAAPACDVDAALARLLPQLDAPAAVQPDPAPVPAPVLTVRPGWRARLAANDRSWLRAGVLLQCAVIAVLAVQLLRPAAGPDAQTAGYRALAAGEGTRASMVVAFKPDTPEHELRRIVLASGARVTGGPTATGAWLLETAEPPAAVVARLRAEPAVLLAEPLSAEHRP
jgi:hypothetical protein